ncbi:hypothetical protein CRYUN_Cryun08bG0053900 [Craigia yunnanensis]
MGLQGHILLQNLSIPQFQAPATVKKIFNLKEFLTKRDAWTGSFEGVINWKGPRTDCPVTLPEPVKMREIDAKETVKLSEFQEELVQMAAVLNRDHKKEIYPHRPVEMWMVPSRNSVMNAKRQKKGEWMNLRLLN